VSQNDFGQGWGVVDPVTILTCHKHNHTLTYLIIFLNYNYHCRRDCPSCLFHSRATVLSCNLTG